MSDDESGELSDFQLSDVDEDDDVESSEADAEDEGEADVEEDDSDAEEGEALAPVKNLQQTIFTTTAVMPSLASLGLSLQGFKPLAIPTMPMLPSPAPVPIPASIQTAVLPMPSYSFPLNTYVAPGHPQPIGIPSPQPTYAPTQSAFQGMQAIMTPGTGAMAPMYTGVQMIPSSGTGAPTITPKTVSPKKTSARSIYYTATDLATLRNEDLKLLAKEVGLKGYSTKKKDDLVAMLLAVPLQGPKTIKVVKTTSEEDLTILPAQSGVAPLQSTQIPVSQPFAVQLGGAFIPFPIDASMLGALSTPFPTAVQTALPTQPAQPNAPIMLGGLGPMPTFNIGSIGPIQTGPAAASVSAGTPGQTAAPITLKELMSKQTGETKDMHTVRTEITEKAATGTTDPQIAANIGSTSTNNAFLGVTYNKDTSNLLATLKI